MHSHEYLPMSKYQDIWTYGRNATGQRIHDYVLVLQHSPILIYLFHAINNDIYVYVMEQLVVVTTSIHPVETS